MLNLNLRLTKHFRVGIDLSPRSAASSSSPTVAAQTCEEQGCWLSSSMGGSVTSLRDEVRSYGWRAGMVVEWRVAGLWDDSEVTRVVVGWVVVKVLQILMEWLHL